MTRRRWVRWRVVSVAAVRGLGRGFRARARRDHPGFRFRGVLTANKLSELHDHAPGCLGPLFKLHLRSRAAIESMFCGLPLLPPGELTYTGDWHPDEDTPPASAPGGSSIWCGIAQKP